jgi:hypothetical protein
MRAIIETGATMAMAMMTLGYNSRRDAYYYDSVDSD